MMDFVGRCIAEQFVSSATYALTLTYGGDVVEATSLYYRDVQRMLYRLRTDGYLVRYICAGEYGEKKGRAHWHVVLFFVGEVPELVLDERIHWAYWPHGFVYAQHANYEGFSYLMKYTLKDDKQRAFRKVLRLSKYPPLGAMYFRDLADRMVQGRLPMHNPEYSFAHCRARGVDGVYRARKFWLTGRSFELFAEFYVDLWEERYGSSPPDTEFLWEYYYDPIAKLQRNADPTVFEISLKDKRKRPEKLPYAVQVAYLLLPRPFIGLVVKYSDGTAVFVREDKKWHLDLGGGRGVRSELGRLGLPKWLSSVVSVWLDPRGQSRELLPPIATPGLG